MRRNNPLSKQLTRPRAPITMRESPMSPDDAHIGLRAYQEVADHRDELAAALRDIISSCRKYAPTIDLSRGMKALRSKP